MPQKSKNKGSDNIFEERFNTILSVVEDGNTVISGINNLSTFILKIGNLITKLDSSHKNTPKKTKWLDAFHDDRPFSVRKREMESVLYQSQNKLAIATRQNASNDIASVSANPDFLSLVSPAALALNTALTLVDGYLTRRTIRQGFEDVTNTLISGFHGLDTTLKEGFQRIDATFHWGFSELMWRIDQQSAVAAQIRDILLKPLDTQSKELRDRGIRSYNFGWMDEALQDLCDAMEKARVDYVIAHYLGNIYLFHKHDYDNAILYYGKAAKYSEPISKPHCVTALIHKGLAFYLADSKNKMEDWRNAADCLRKALELMPDNLEIHFQYAQYCALSDQKNFALASINRIVRNDPKYVVKILTEPDFKIIQEDIAIILLQYQGELNSAFRNSVITLKNTIIPAITFFKNALDDNGISIISPDLSYYWWHESEKDVKIIEKGWKLDLKNGKIKPKKSSLLSTAYSQLEEALNKIETITETYQNGDIISLWSSVVQLKDIRLPSIEREIGTVDLKLRVLWYREPRLPWVHSGWDVFKEEKESYTFDYYCIGGSFL